MKPPPKRGYDYRTSKSVQQQCPAPGERMNGDEEKKEQKGVWIHALTKRERKGIGCRCESDCFRCKTVPISFLGPATVLAIMNG